jgi:hypothetical protein
MNIETSLETESENIFNGDDFVFTKKTDKYGKTEVVGGGYKIKSLFLEHDIPALQTMNADNNEQNGGKVSSPFENLAVPAGLFYINQRVPKRNIDKGEYDFYKPHDTLPDDMLDKLFGLVETDKKKQRKTRKHTNKIEKPIKRKTRKNM